MQDGKICHCRKPADMFLRMGRMRIKTESEKSRARQGKVAAGFSKARAVKHPQAIRPVRSRVGGRVQGRLNRFHGYPVLNQ